MPDQVRHDGKGGKDGFSLLSLFLSSLLPRTWTRSVGTALLFSKDGSSRFCRNSPEFDGPVGQVGVI